MKKVLFVATVVKTHIMEFHIPYLKLFKDAGWHTSVAARNDYDNPQECVIPFCDTYYDIPFERNPLKVGNIFAYRELKKVINSGEYDIIHCHTPVGGTLSRMAAIAARERGCRVIYTAHGFHFYKGSPLINWVLFFPVEKLLAKYTDVIITINKEDYRLAKTFNARDVVYIPGVGIDTDRFTTKVNNDKEIRDSLKIPRGSKVILSVGEVNRNKNHKVIIEALPFLSDYYYVICGRGPLIEDCETLAKKLGVNERIRMAGYREDVESFYRIADIFAFPSYREGLPVALMEAMAAGLPIICTNIRGSADLVTEGENGYFFQPSDFKSVLAAVQSVNQRKETISQRNIEKAKQFSINHIKVEYASVYGIEAQ